MARAQRRSCAEPVAPSSAAPPGAGLRPQPHPVESSGKANGVLDRRAVIGQPPVGLASPCGGRGRGPVPVCPGLAGWPSSARPRRPRWASPSRPRDRRGARTLGVAAGAAVLAGSEAIARHRQRPGEIFPCGIGASPAPPWPPRSGGRRADCSRRADRRPPPARAVPAFAGLRPQKVARGPRFSGWPWAACWPQTDPAGARRSGGEHDRARVSRRLRGDVFSGRPAEPP